MQEIQTRGIGNDAHALITDKLRDGPVLIAEEGQTPFVAVGKDQWLRVIDYLEENGLVEEILMEEEIDPTESFKRGWEQMLRGEVLPLSEMWEGIDAD